MLSVAQIEMLLAMPSVYEPDFRTRGRRDPRDILVENGYAAREFLKNGNVKYTVTSLGREYIKVYNQNAA